MWVVLIAVGVVVLVIAGGAVWLFAAPVGGPAEAGPTPHPSSVATQGPLPEATPTTGSEVLPPATGDAGGSLPLPPAASSLMTGPPPASASGTAQLVAGFQVLGFWHAVGASIVFSLVAWLLSSLVQRTPTR